MLIIPLTAVPAQTVEVILVQQSCRITVRQKSTGMYLDLYKSGALLIGGVICQDRNRIVRDAYFGFIGDLCFLDNEGREDPVFTGLGVRFSLAYLEVADLLLIEGA
jgi:hypothetical protein